ncbi:codanin-1 [Sitophilus oryzae]|uniref:Codanin-1 n=1 Tax=Sitophilus oryzae TaxID=7048 RepID=A0A6J2XTD3_SITOR|nr:codanin-1 [Sitophilus oryzae]
MADILLNKIINEELNINLFIKWLECEVPENDLYNEILIEKVAKIDFITYFINFIHDQSCTSKCNDLLQRNNTPKRIQKTQSRPLQTSKSKNIQHNLFPPNEKPVSNFNNHSTPESSKKPDNTVKRTECYLSPISPLYQDNSSFLKNNITLNGSQKSADKYSLCLGDFITHNPKKIKKKKLPQVSGEEKKEAPRRIKPTTINIKEQDHGFKNVGNSFNFEKNNTEVAACTIEEQRNMLIAEKDKVLSNKSVTDQAYPIVLRRLSGTYTVIQPTLAKVTLNKEIDYIIKIYQFILNNQLILNMTSEIYFLISLLLIDKVDSKENSTLPLDDSNLGIDFLDQPNKEHSKILNIKLYNTQLFESIHNIVYFATKCLELQVAVIKFYDKSTLELLANNRRIQEFSPSFSKKLLASVSHKTEKPYNEIITLPSQSNVCFNIDTDNRDNFSDDKGFHAFRKQRDLFYEILRIWENNHLLPDWSYGMGLSGRIRTLFSLSTDPVSYIHLARLFKNQLLISCSKGPKEKGVSERGLSFFPSLSINPNKLNQLTNRLIMKESTNGINSLPSFTGYQEFYKDFIVVSASHCFNKHLSDILASDIIELNETKFWVADLNKIKDVDSKTRKQYISCIKNLRLLAKFLGFIESLPYKSDSMLLSKNAFEVQLKIRSQCNPLLDVKSMLRKAISEKKLVLLIPWLTKYLSMLDQVSLRLPYYAALHQMLFELYLKSHFDRGNSYSIAIMKFCLGWLFELPHFPDSDYFSFCSKQVFTKTEFDSEILMRSNGHEPKEDTNLDSLKLVNESVLYVCCPYLEEIRKLLSSSGGKVSVKYITPVTAVESNSELLKKKLENQLEEAFFNGQPSSLRKTVEFVSERVASAAVKHICNDMVPKAKSKVLSDFGEHISKENIKEENADMLEYKNVLKKKASSFVEGFVRDFLRDCNEAMYEIAEKKIHGCIDNLLPLDALEEIKNVCVGFTYKMYVERVKQWLATHVSSSIFLKELENDIQKGTTGRRIEKDKANFTLPPGGRSCPHNESTLSGCHILNLLREACCEVIEYETITVDVVLNLLDQIYISLTRRNDINDMMIEIIHYTLFDLCLLLVSHCSAMFKHSGVMENMLKVWKCEFGRSSTIFKNLFCVKNITILQSSKVQCNAWDTYAKVVSYLVDKELIIENDLEFQCTSFYQRDWDEDTLEKFSRFIKQYLSCRKCNETDDKFAMLLSFLSDFCVDFFDRL